MGVIAFCTPVYFSVNKKTRTVSHSGHLITWAPTQISIFAAIPVELDYMQIYTSLPTMRSSRGANPGCLLEHGECGK